RWRQESRSRRREEGSGEKEVIWPPSRFLPGWLTALAHGEPSPHRGFGQSGRSIQAHTAQCRIRRGGKIGEAMARAVCVGKEVQRVVGLGASGRAEGFIVSAADFHECERRSGADSGRLL